MKLGRKWLYVIIAIISISLAEACGAKYGGEYEPPDLSVSPYWEDPGTYTETLTCPNGHRIHNIAVEDESHILNVSQATKNKGKAILFTIVTTNNFQPDSAHVFLSGNC